jgi:hypothetical protein
VHGYLAFSSLTSQCTRRLLLAVLRQHILLPCQERQSLHTSPLRASPLRASQFCN